MAGMSSRTGAAEQKRHLAEQRRAQTQHDREKRQAYEQSRAEAAATVAAQAQAQARALAGILPAALAGGPYAIDLTRFRKAAPSLALDHGADAVPVPLPQWAQFAPSVPGALGRIFVGEARLAAREQRARAEFDHAVAAAQAAEAQRRRRVAEANQAHAIRVAALTAQVVEHNQQVDTFAAAVADGDRHAVSKYYQRVMAALPDPADFPRERRCGYVPESTLLALEWRLPPVDIVPAIKGARWVKSRDEIVHTARPIAEIRNTYQQLVAQLALRAVHAAFAADQHELVDTVVFNGLLDAVEPSTGQPVVRCLITLRANREQYAGLVLEQVDPVACVRKYFAAQVSPHPDELEPVTPIMEFDMADPRTIDPIDIISSLDTRPNLLELTPREFEHFVQNLFERMGFDTKVYRASRDGGVDCVAYDPTPITGGKYVVQAKQTHDTVPPTAVRDLFGTMQHEGAHSGILVTTSGYGASSYEFANGKPLQLIDRSGLLALCQKWGVPAQIVKTKATRQRRR